MGTMFHTILFSPVAVDTDCIQSTIFRGICLIVWDMDTAGDSGIITEKVLSPSNILLITAGFPLDPMDVPFISDILAVEFCIQ